MAVARSASVKAWRETFSARASVRRSAPSTVRMTAGMSRRSSQCGPLGASAASGRNIVPPEDAGLPLHVSDDRLRASLDLELLNPDHLSVAALQLVVGLERAVECALETSRGRGKHHRSTLSASALQPGQQVKPKITTMVAEKER